MKYSSNLLLKKVTIDSSSSSSSCSMCVKFQQMITLLLLAIAMCASGISSNPTPLDNQQQQQQHSQQQQQQQQQLQLQLQHPATALRVQQCREGCLEKFSTKSSLCPQKPECLTCWNECSKMPPSKISKSIRETWSLHTVSMVQQDSLVLVDVAWEQLSLPSQCLVTWEVSGGGLMGNLLTESFNVQLSLWPDTKYRVQVTCKNKLSGLMSRSLPLTINTSEAVKAIDTELVTFKPTVRNEMIKAYVSNIPNSKLASTTVLPPLATHGVDSEEEIDTNVVPYDHEDSEERSATEPNARHTTYLFDWRLRTNSDITFVEPLQHDEGDLLSLLNRVHKPLLFGMTAGISLLMLLLLFFACPLRCLERSSDKAMLLAEDLGVESMSIPPAVMIGSSKSVGVTTQDHDHNHVHDHDHDHDHGVCKSPATCSRYTPRV